MARTALLVIDLQNDYFEGGRMALEGPDAAAANAARLMAAFRARGLPVIPIQHVMRTTPAPFFQKGTDGVEINASVRPLAGETVIVKGFPNSFRETGLKAALDAEGVSDLVITGAMSHMCVDATTRAAVDLGYACTVAHDACATRALSFGGVDVPAAHVHAAFMAALASSYGRVIATDDILASLAE